jgi:adenosine deaminase
LFTAEDTFAWDNFIEFLRIYDEASYCMRSGEDYEEIMYEYLKQSAAEGVIYLETFVSPDHAATVGISYKDMVHGCARAIDRAHIECNILGRLIVSCVRHLGPEQALKVAQITVQNPHPYVVGFGMGGNEFLYTQADFAPAFKLAHAAGLGCTSHAGEVVGSESVWDAIDNLPVTRIGHGVRSVEDSALMQTLKQRGIALEVCPSSNLALKVYPDWASHPLNTILDAGISLSLNADDPPFFATTTGTEYQNAVTHFGLSVAQLKEISCMSIKASFADTETKQQLLARI